MHSWYSLDLLFGACCSRITHGYKVLRMEPGSIVCKVSTCLQHCFFSPVCLEEVRWWGRNQVGSISWKNKEDARRALEDPKAQWAALPGQGPHQGRGAGVSLAVSIERPGISSSDMFMPRASSRIRETLGYLSRGPSEGGLQRGPGSA